MTPEAERMAGIVRDHAPLLKHAGFKKRRHCFNRLTSDALVHVVRFWMAPKEPPAWTEVPGLRERCYGSFRIDFGVYVPEMNRLHTPTGDWINEHHCQLSRTIGSLVTGEDKEFWWQLADPLASILARDGLERYGLPWLDQFPDRESVLAAFEREGNIAVEPAGDLDIADLYRALGRTAEERLTLERYATGHVHGNHAAYLIEYLQRHGHDDLSARVRAH